MGIIKYLDEIRKLDNKKYLLTQVVIEYFIINQEFIMESSILMNGGQKRQITLSSQN